MGTKRKHDEGEAGSDPTSKKARKGFTVGPANLPDGTYRRKAQKIKQSLIHKAKLKKDYAKIKEREMAQNPETFTKSAYPTTGDDDNADAGTKSPTLEIHPERQAMLSNPEIAPQQQSQRPAGSALPSSRSARRRNKRHKPKPFEKEGKVAQQRQAEGEARKQAIQEGERQCQRKVEERAKFRKVMAKARSGGKNGQRKLGLESKVLFEKAKRVMDE